MFFYISLLLSSVASFGSMGLIGGGIMGLASTYPAVYMQTVMLGQSIAGIFSSVLSILCQAFASDDVINGRIYFVIALFWTVASVFFYAYLVVVSRRRNCVGHYTRVDSSVSDDERARLQEAEDDDVINEEATSPESGGGKGQYGMVLKQARLDMLCVFLVLLITLSGFPALSSQVKSTSKNTTWTAYFSAICCFLVFNVGDSLGRLFGNAVHISRHSLLYVCLFRLVFIPLIALCNVEPRYNTVTLLPYDGFFLLVMILFALTQGFTMTQSTINVGRSVDESLREVSGSMINLACVASALTGSLVGAVIVDLV